jgi:hypothetical protein
MRIAIAFAALAALVACGADGPPVRPSANLGVNVGADGISPFANIGASAGPVSLGINL